MNATPILQFLRELSENNNREWFMAHKAQYDLCRAEFEQICTELIRRIAAYDPEVGHLQAKDCIYRIYRDVRFSPDKSPYKRHFGCFIAKNGARNSDFAGYYFHLQPGACEFACGAWCPPSDLLREIRQSVYDNIEELLQIIDQPDFKAAFPTMWVAEKLKTVPRGFPKDWEHSDLLKYRHYCIEHPISDAAAHSDALLDELEHCARLAAPFNAFLNYTIEEWKA